MKKAKKLIAVLLAVVMLASAACLPVYAKRMADNTATPDRLTTNQKYYFGAEKGCSYLLDMLDEMLGEMYLYMSWEYLVNNDDSTGGGILQWAIESVLSMPPLNFTSIDNAINTIYTIIDEFDSGLDGTIAGWATGDLLDILTKTGLDPNVKRSTRDSDYNGGSSDMKVLFNLLSWLSNNKDLFIKIIAGTIDLGLLDSLIMDLEIAGMPLLQDIDKYVPILLYQLLVDETVTADTMPAGETIETGLQKVINWALIDGTGEAPENGGTSLLGPNFEPLIGNALTYDQVSITNLGVYEFVNNLLNGLLNGMLAPMLGDLIADLVGIEEDGSIDDATTFNLIIGLVEGLLVDNGADPPEYTGDEASRTPQSIVNDLVDWLFEDGALQVFIKTDISGIGLTDNFMSLLNDLIRLAINLLPALGLEIPDGLLPSADALTDFYYYKKVVNEETGEETLVRCEKTDPDKFDQLYQTYYGKQACYAVYGDDGEIDHYRYFDGQQLPVNIADTSAADYENPDFIRPYYIMSMDQVWAAVMKAVFTLLVEGPYFPEWATTMEAVLAYGSAGLAVAILPEGDWYDRLDAWHLSGGSTEAYTMPTGNTVIPLPYSNTTARSATNLPTGAMSILSGVGAYYLNTMLDLTANQQFTTINTSFEQLLTELALWAMTTYLPMLSGELNTSTGLVYTTEYAGTFGETRYPGTFAAETNTLINACYTNFASRTQKANPDWGAVYTYLDSTLLSLIPADWLPAQYFDSYALFNDWLFGNIVKFDLQGLLGILSANNSGELTEPLLTVLLRVIDRLLATVFGGDALMLPTDRNHATKNVYDNHTSITTLTALLEDGDGGNENASLPELVDRLFTLLNKHKGLLFCTLFPLIRGGNYEKPFDRDALNSEDDFVNTLGTDMSRYKIGDLENQLRTLTKNVNAIQINRTDYSSLTAVEYGTYATAEEAAAAQAELGDAYCSTVEVDGGFLVNRHLNADDVLAQYKAQYGEDANIYVETIERVAGTSTTAPVYEFNVYQGKDYFSSATMTESTDDYGTVYVFSDFNYKSINPSSATNPLVTWDDGAYYFWESEDTNPNAFYYANYNDAVSDAESFVDSYKNIATSTLPDAFGKWFEYSIDTFCVAADLNDSNLDGKSVLSTSDGDYVADNADTTDVNEETPVDGLPSAPDAMYPYYNADDTANVKWVDDDIDAYNTQARNSFIRSGESTAYPGFEVLNMAEAYGNDHANDVLLDPYYTEKVVRYALWANNGNNASEALKFDITANADGSYTGNGTASRQWASLSETEIGYVRDLCVNYFMNLKQNAETGEYQIYRWAFTYASNLQYPKADGSTDLNAMPRTSRHYIGDDGPNTYQEAENAMYDGYIDYVDTIYSSRRSLYNQLETLNWRIEQAEENRAKAIEPKMLEWALNHVDHAYKTTDGRNRKYVGSADGVDIYTKVYTSSSYAVFQKAYDYAKSLSTVDVGQASGVTQSMVTMAFQKLLEAYNALVEYAGDADWVQYKAYLTLAQQIAKPVSEGGNADHPTLGLQPESRQALADIIAQAIAFSGELTEAGDSYRTENFDCERQEEIDAMAASINAVILNLKYLSNPNLIIADGSDNLKLETGTEVDNDGNVHTYGWIIGLKEGEGLSLDNVTEVGMLINEGKGDYLALEESAKGVGTGARIDGYINTYSRFRYYGVLYGDLNGDARVDGTDWAKLSYYLLTNPDSPTVGFPETHVAEAADANHEGGITIADADLIKAHYNYSKTINQSESGTGVATTGL